MPRKLVLAVAVCLLVIAFVAYTLRRRPLSPLDLNPATSAAVASDMQADGAMSQSDYLELTKVHDRVVDSGGRISDDDLEFMIGLLHKPTKWPGIANFSVLGVLDLLKVMTPSQEQTIFGETMPLTRFPETSNDIGNTRRMAAAVLGITKDKRAVPALLPLLRDKYPYVRKEATKSLRRLGYSGT